MMDENEGHGGSYTVDKDGKKTLVERTAPAPELVRETTAEPDAPKGKKSKPAADEVTDAKANP